MLCGVIRSTNYDKEKILSCCSIVELRLDLLGTASVEKIRKDIPLPMIFTHRTGEIKEDVTPEYIDLEYPKESTYKTKLIVSTHDFEKMPPLEETLKKMQMIRADFYKMAFYLHSSLEALELLIFMRQNPNVIAMGMGPYGEVTRILAPIFGAPFVYASIDKEEATAPGQLTISELAPFKNVNPSTAIYGLIGDPVDKSLSHLSHNEVLRGHNAVYVKFQVTKEQLPQFIELAKKAGIQGLSITMPLKEAVTSLLDENHATDGAVNTLLFKEDKIIGYNTDGKGALDTLGDVKGKRITIIGSGGASKAIAAEAALRGALVSLLRRGDTTCPKYDILINATPSPMPISADWIVAESVVMDVNTNPMHTPFLKEASKKNCTLHYGYEMFINQAAEQFRLWLKLENVKEVIRESVLKNITKE